MRTRNFISQNGFTLQETMVVIAISLIVLAVALSLLVITQSNVINVTNSVLANESIESLRQSLALEGQCTNSLKGLPLSILNTSGSNVADLGIAAAGHLSEGIMIANINLKPISQIGTIWIASELQVTYAPLTVRRIGILAQVKQGHVEKCWVQKSGADRSADAMCIATSGGGLDQWDPVKNQCVLANGQWFGSTLSTASCPSGTVPAPNPTEADCNVVPPTNFADTFPIINVPTTDGKFTTVTRPPYFLKMSTSGVCSCIYALDLNVTATSGFQCQIQCIVL